MVPPTPHAPPARVGSTPEGATCRRSRLSPQLRIGITFVVLFALKWTLPFVLPGQALQVLVLLVAVTFFAWRFWWHCGTDRRGPIILIATTWAAGLAKILLAAR